MIGHYNPKTDRTSDRYTAFTEGDTCMLDDGEDVEWQNKGYRIRSRQEADMIALTNILSIEPQNEYEKIAKQELVSIIREVIFN